MTENAKAKILPSLLLMPAPVIAGIGPQLLGMPPDTVLFWAVAVMTATLALGLSGARDDDPTRRLFHRGAPAYWVPALVWLVAVVAAAAGPVIEPHPPGMRWLFLVAGAIHALADLGCRIKDR